MKDTLSTKEYGEAIQQLKEEWSREREKDSNHSVANEIGY